MSRVSVTAEEPSDVARVRFVSPDRLYIELDLRNGRPIDEKVVDGYRVKAAPMDDVVARARKLVGVSLEHHDDLVALGSRPIKGVLFTSPPGTEKTMFARIVANRAGATFYELSGPELINEWFGESEKIPRAISKAAAAEKGRSSLMRSTVSRRSEAARATRHRDASWHNCSHSWTGSGPRTTSW